MPQPQSPTYEPVHTIRDHETGLECAITRRQDTGIYSFRIEKVYEKDGQVRRTSYLNRRHLVALRRLIVQVEEWLDSTIEREQRKARG